MQPKLGLLAGGGQLPAEIVKICLTDARPIYVIPLKGHADLSLTASLSPPDWTEARLGAAGRIIDLLHQNNVKDLVLAGSVHRPQLRQLFPDFWALRFLITSGAFSFGDDGLLRRLISALEDREGFRVIGADSLLPHLLVPKGSLTKVELPSGFDQDLEIGIKAASELGRQDIGQAVIVQNGTVIAQEDRKGTDALIKRVAEHSERPAGGILVKMMKPEQERRADLPAIGPNTMKQIKLARLSGVAIEAGNAFILERNQMIELSEQENLFVHGISPDQVKAALYE